MHDNEPMVDGPIGLPDEEGFEAVLEAEEQRARRHGGIHGLVLVELTDPGPQRPREAAIALSRALRETDLLAQIDHLTFGVLALHCHDLEAVVARLREALDGVGLRATVDSRAAGTNLPATWTAMVTGVDPEPAPLAARYLTFVATLPPSLN